MYFHFEKITGCRAEMDQRGVGMEEGRSMSRVSQRLWQLGLEYALETMRGK